MTADSGNTSSAPISVAERVAALQKAEGGRSSSAYKPNVVRRLPTAVRPPSTNTVSKKSDNALADRIAEYQNGVKKADSTETRATVSVLDTNQDDARDDTNTNVTTERSSTSTVTNTNRPPEDQPHVQAKPRTISMASRISVMQKTINPERRSKANHPSRNMTTTIQSSMRPPATSLPPRVSAFQETNGTRASTKPDRLSDGKSMTVHESAANGVMKSQPPSSQAILIDQPVSITAAPQPKRQGPILKDATNLLRNKVQTKKNVNLSLQTNNKLNREGRGNAQAADKSFTGTSDVDSDMITLPTSNVQTTLDSSFDDTASSSSSSSSWNYEKTIHGWQTFYTNFSIPPPSAMIESHISTPVIKNSSRTSGNYKSDDGDLAYRRTYERTSSKIRKDDRINPSRSGYRRKNDNCYQDDFDTDDELDTDDSSQEFDAANDDSNQAFDLNGCLIMDEIWSVFDMLSYSV